MFDFIRWHGERAGNVTAFVFLFGADVHENDLIVLEPALQLRGRHGLQLIRRLVVELCYLFDLGEAFPAQSLEASQQAEYVFVGEAVKDLLAFLTRLHHSFPAQRLEVCAGIPHGKRGFPRDRLDGSLALGK